MGEYAEQFARLYGVEVVCETDPGLVVNDLKTGPDAKGGVALWIDVGTLAHFRNLTVTRAAAGS